METKPHNCTSIIILTVICGLSACASTATHTPLASTQPAGITRNAHVGIPTDIGVPVDDGTFQN